MKPVILDGNIPRLRGSMVNAPEPFDLRTKMTSNDRLKVLKPLTGVANNNFTFLELPDDVYLYTDALLDNFFEGITVYDNDLKIPFVLRKAVFKFDAVEPNNTGTVNVMPTQTFKSINGNSFSVGDELYIINGGVSPDARSPFIADILPSDLLLGVVTAIDPTKPENITFTVDSGAVTAWNTILTTWKNSTVNPLGVGETYNFSFKLKKTQYYNGVLGSIGLQWFYYGINAEKIPSALGIYVNGGNNLPLGVTPTIVNNSANTVTQSPTPTIVNIDGIESEPIGTSLISDITNKIVKLKGVDSTDSVSVDDRGTSIAFDVNFQNPNFISNIQNISSSDSDFPYSNF